MRAVREFHPEDLNPGLHRPGDLVGHNEAMRLLTLHGSFIRTLEVDGERVAVIGMAVRWRGVADVWAVIGDGARGHGVWLTRTCNRLLEQFAEELELHRVGCTIKDGAEENLRWIEALGFVREGVEYFAGPDGEHLLRYVRWTRPERVN